MNLLSKLLLVTSLGMACGAQATVINSISAGATSHPFGTDELLRELVTLGPVSESGFTWTSTWIPADDYAYSVYAGGFGTLIAGLDENGIWGADFDPDTAEPIPFPYISLETVEGFMTVTFDKPVSSVLAFINHAHSETEDYGLPYMAIYGVDGNLIEDYFLNISSPSGTLGLNEGEDWGFSQPSAVIKSFVLGDAYIVAANLRTETTETVPEPASLALLGIGLAGLGAMRRRQRA